MKKLHIILLSAAALISLGASAQSFRSGYFLDNYTYGYRINPAQVNDRGFLGIGVGNIDLQNSMSFGLSSFLFNKDGSIVTGLNHKVGVDEFLGGLKDNSFISLDESINILSFGIANGKRMHTVELNVRVMDTENLPKSLFEFAKKGSGTYNLGGLYADVSAMADLAYGYSMNINDNLSVGGRLHLLLGLANVNLSGGELASIQMTEDKLSITPNFALNASGLVGANATSGGEIDMSSIGLNTKSPIGGFGASVDLGVEYKSDFGLEAMFSVTDLGLINWKNSFTAVASDPIINVDGNKERFTFKDGSIDANLDDILNVTQGYKLHAGTGQSSTSLMPFNIAAGARYFMPFYDKLSVGVLATYHNAKYSSWFDARLGATITPARIISLTGNIGYGSFGPIWGSALDLHLGPINLLVGVDSFLGKYGTLAGIPVPLKGFPMNAHVGLCITF